MAQSSVPRQTGQIVSGDKSSYVTQEFIDNPIVRQVFEKYGLKLYNPQIPGKQGEQWSLVPQQMNYWQDSRRIGRYYQAINQMPDGAQIPDWLDAGRLNAAYSELSRTYGSDWQNWPLLRHDDPVMQFFGDMEMPPEAARPAWEIEQERIASELDARVDSKLNQYVPGTVAGQVGVWTQYGIDKETWDKLPEWKKGANWLFRSGHGMAAQQAVNFGILGASMSGANPLVTAGFMCVGAGFGYLSDAERKRAERAFARGEEYKPGAAYYAGIALDWAYRNSQKVLGLRMEIINSAKDPETYGTVLEILGDLENAYNAGAAFYATAPFEVEQYYGKPLQRFFGELKETTDQWEWNQKLSELMGLTAELTEEQLQRAEEHKQRLEDNTFTIVNIAGEDTQISLPRGVSPSGLALVEARRALQRGEIGADQVLEWTMAKYGFSAEMADLIGGYALDPLDMIGPVSSTVIGGAAMAKGNTALGNAMLNQPGGVFGADLLTGARLYRQNLRQMPVAELAHQSNFAKWFSGADRLVRDATTQPKEKRNFLDYMFGMTPTARATEVQRNFNEGLASLLTNDGDNVDGMYRIVSDLSGGKPQDVVDGIDNRTIRLTVGGKEVETAIPRWFQSSEAQFIPAMMTDVMPKVNDLYDSWRNSRPNAAVIQRFADVLGDKPAALISDLHNGRQTLDALRSRLQALADEGNASAKQLLDDLNPNGSLRDLNNSAMKKIADGFSGKDGLAFDPQLWGVQLMYALAEHADAWTARWFGVKQNHWAIRLGSVIKQLQAGFLLNTPIYYGNNGLNNIITMAWDGLIGMTPKKSRMSFLRRFGVIPTFLRQGVGAADFGGDIDAGRIMTGDGQEAKTYSIGRELKKAGRAGDKDLIQKTSDLLHSTDKLMPFINESQRMERWTSEIATERALRQYWDNSWELAHDKLSPDLKLALEAVEVGLGDRVETLINRGLSKKEIERDLFRDLDRVSIRDVLSKEELDVLNHFPKILDGIDDGMRTAKTTDDVLRVMDKARIDAMTEIKNEVQRNMRTAVRQAALVAQVSGMGGVFDYFDNVVPQRYEMWNGHMEKMDQVAQQVDKLPPKEGDALWRSTMQEADLEWRTFEEMEGGRWLGAFEGLGAEKMSNEYALVMKNLTVVHDVWRNFYQTRRNLMDEFFGFVPDDGLSPAEASALKSAKWADVSEKLNAEYVEAILIEDAYQRDLDAMFVERYGKHYNAVSTQKAAQWRDSILKVRRAMVQAMLAWRMGAIPGKVTEAWGNLLPAKTLDRIRKLNNGEPIYKMSTGERSDANRKFYREVYQPFLRQMLDARNTTTPSTTSKYEPKVKKPKTEEPKVEEPKGKPVEPANMDAEVKRLLNEKKPELAQADEGGQPEIGR